MRIYQSDLGSKKSNSSGTGMNSKLDRTLVDVENKTSFPQILSTYDLVWRPIFHLCIKGFQKQATINAIF